MLHPFPSSGRMLHPFPRSGGMLHPFPRSGGMLRPFPRKRTQRRLKPKNSHHNPNKPEVRHTAGLKGKFRTDPRTETWGNLNTQRIRKWTLRNPKLARINSCDLKRRKTQGKYISRSPWSPRWQIAIVRSPFCPLHICTKIYQWSPLSTFICSVEQVVRGSIPVLRMLNYFENDCFPKICEERTLFSLVSSYSLLKGYVSAIKCRCSMVSKYDTWQHCHSLDKMRVFSFCRVAKSSQVRWKIKDSIDLISSVYTYK